MGAAIKVMSAYTGKYWDTKNSAIAKHPYRDTMHEYKRFCYDEALRGYHGDRVLITDLFDEAFDCHNLFDRQYIEGNVAVGMDISRKIAHRVKENYPDALIVCCDVRALPFKQDHFDLVLSPSTLDHFPEYDLELSLKELKRVTNSQGKMFITLGNKHNLWLHYSVLNWFNLVPYDVFTFGRKDLLHICKKIGLAESSVATMCHLPIPYVTSKFMNTLRLFNTKTRKQVFHLIEKLKNLPSRFITSEFLVIRAVK